VLFFLACHHNEKSQDSPVVEADTDTDTDSDTDIDSGPLPSGPVDSTPADTGLAMEYFEGNFSIAENRWSGTESKIATPYGPGADWCRVSNLTSGSPADQVCDGCDWAFRVQLGTGTMTGDHCEIPGWAADDSEGDEWLYGLMPVYRYYYYTYRNALMLGYYDNRGDAQWSIFAQAEALGNNEYEFRSIWAYYFYYTR